MKITEYKKGLKVYRKNNTVLVNKHKYAYVGVTVSETPLFDKDCNCYFVLVAWAETPTVKAKVEKMNLGRLRVQA